MSRLIVVTQHVDPEHPALAATIPKLEALARRVDEVVVLALGARPGVLPPNCRVVVFGGRNRLLRTLRLWRGLLGALRGERPLAVVAHMAPVYAILAAPLVRPRRVPLLLWYTHWRATPALRLAERLVTTAISVDRRSFPLPSRKVIGLGHGIDLGQFACRPAPPPADELRLLSLGRTSPAKGVETMLRAVRLATDAGVRVRLRVVGPSLTGEERRHRDELGRLRAELGLEELVSLEHAVPREEVPALLAEADAVVNNMRAGAPDKAVYEAAASCVPVLASNPVFDELLPARLRFRRDSPDELAGRLRELAALEPAERERLGRELRAGVEAAHTADSWAEGVLSAARRR